MPWDQLEFGHLRSQVRLGFAGAWCEQMRHEPGGDIPSVESSQQKSWEILNVRPNSSQFPTRNACAEHGKEGIPSPWLCRSCNLQSLH